MTGRAILIAQPNMGGHRFNYCRILVQHAARAGRQVTILTTSSGAETFRQLAPEAAGSVEFATLSSEAMSLADLAHVARSMAGVGLVLVPDGDRLAGELAVRGGWRGPGMLRLLIMRPSAQPGRLRALRTILRRCIFLFWHLLPRVELVLLRSAVRPTLGLLPRVADPIELMATPETISRLRQSNDITHSRYWFTIAGALDERKNVLLVMSALELATGDSLRPLGLILSGVQTQRLRMDLASDGTAHAYRLVVDDRHLSQDELDSYILLSDAVVLAHSNEGPSGILGKAVAAGTRVLASGASSLRRDCLAIGPSATWCPLDKDHLAHLLANASRCDRPAPTTQVAGPDVFCDRLLRIGGAS
jgi:hypothetical protein